MADQPQTEPRDLSAWPQAERWLRIVLRVTAAAMMVAVVAVVMPRSWLSAAHRGLGLGELPPGVLVEYLARTLSALYAAVGGLLWLVSYNVRKHVGVIRYVAAAMLVLAITIVTALWPHSDEPFYWLIVIDASTGVAFGIVTLVLARKLPK